jgi:two-component system OmpR family response regulator
MAAPERWSNLGSVDVPVSLVLVVEDNPEDAQFVKSALEARRMSVRIAKDAGQAHTTMQMHQPDFIIIDAILPGDSGFELCERIRMREEKVPILFLSAIDLDDARNLAQRVGANGYLTKPVTPEALMTKIQEIADSVWRRDHMEEDETGEERVKFTCTCGKRFRVSSSHRGKSLTCPQCGEPLIVPKRST